MLYSWSTDPATMMTLAGVLVRSGCEGASKDDPDRREARTLALARKRGRQRLRRADAANQTE